MPDLKQYRLKGGSFHTFDPTNPDAPPTELEAGGILETEEDMIKKEGPDRWELLGEADQETVEDLRARLRRMEERLAASGIEETEAEETELDEFGDMSVKELKTYAETSEIDLGGATLKAEILQAIRAHEDAA